MQSYLFYDIETTGLSKPFDQILQFAAIRTDSSLKETDRYNISLKLRPDVIPSPYAGITHRISIASCENGMAEIEALRHIHALFNTPGTISLGYNTLGFDDEFLRFAFYRNLLSPYTHQYAAGCARADILPLSVLYYLYRPAVLKWPEIEGKTSLKLEHIASSNDFDLGRAHDAMVDVEATLELAKRFLSEKPMWDYVTGFFDKKTDKERLVKLPVAFETSAGIHSTGLMTGIKFGAENLYQIPVLYIGDSVPYSNQSLWLRLDQPELRDTDADNIGEGFRVIRKRAGESPIILPPLDRYLEKLTSERKEIVEENLRWLRSESDLFYRIINYYREYRYPDIPGVDADAALYLNGFMSKEEQKLANRFHQASPEELPGIIENFGDSPCREIALRICYRNGLGSPSCLQDKTIEGFINRLNPETDEEAMIDFRGERRLTPDKAMAELRELRQNTDRDNEPSGLLDELEEYLDQRFGESRFKKE